MFMRESSPELTHTDPSMTTTATATDDAAEPVDHDSSEGSVGAHPALDKAEDGAMVKDNEESVMTDEQSVQAGPKTFELSQAETSQENNEEMPLTEDESTQVDATEEQVIEPEQDSERPLPDAEAPTTDASSTTPADVKDNVSEGAPKDSVIQSESMFFSTTSTEALESNLAREDETETGATMEESETPMAPETLSREKERSEEAPEVPDGAPAQETKPPAVDHDTRIEEKQEPAALKQIADVPIADLNEDQQMEAAITLPEPAAGIPEAPLDTAMENSEEQVQETPSLAKDSPVEPTTLRHDGETLSSGEQSLQADATLAVMSESASEEGEGSSLSSLSDDEMEETEHLEEEEYTLTELREGEEDEEDDATSIPSPSLSAVASPRFSSIADTLTLNLPDRTPPKSRTTKEIPEEPASPIDEDTAFLKDFLSRADASKASREAATSRLESIANRRDSDVVRQALCSPRVALENKDPNSPNTSSASSAGHKAVTAKESSPLSTNTPFTAKKLDFSDLTSDLTLEKPPDAPEASQTPEPTPSCSSKSQTTRRSSRARQTRLPATPSASSAGPNRITFRGANHDPIVLKKTEAQEMAALTRNNTRRNKGGALVAPIRLNKLKAEALKASENAEKGEEVLVYADERVEVWKASRLRWDQQLVYFQEESEGGLAGLTSLSDDELAGPVDVGPEQGGRKRKEKSSDGEPAATTPARTKRARGLGAGNGTPAKGLLAPAASLLPEGVVQQQGQDEVKEEKKGAGKKSAAASSSGKGGAPRSKRAPKEVSLAPPASAEPSKTPSSAAEQPSSSSLPSTATAQATDASQPPPPPPSNLPTPSSRRSRLQTPRKVKLPVSVSSTTPAAATTSSATSSSTTQQSASGRTIGSTPRKMGGPTAISKPSAPSAASEAAAAGSGSQGLSSGGRRRAAAAARRL